MPRTSFALLATAVALLLAACGDDSPTGVDGGGDGGGDTRTIKAEPSFATDINEILQRRTCANSGCHGSGAGGLSLTTSATTNYAALVGVTAASEAFPLVDPGDAANSYIVIKTEGSQSVGQRMPLGASALDNIDQTNLRNWINTGAPNN
jgi:hypothetical protein